MRVGIIGTGAISHKHALAYRNIGFRITVCTDIDPNSGRKLRPTARRGLRSHVRRGLPPPRCRLRRCLHFPDFRLQPLRLCAESGKHVQVQKPISTNLATAREMVETARAAGIPWASSASTASTIPLSSSSRPSKTGRLGRLIQCDAYVKWFRSAGVLQPAHQGQLGGRGGGALINQASTRSTCCAGSPAPWRKWRPCGSWARCTGSNPRTW